MLNVDVFFIRYFIYFYCCFCLCHFLPFFFFLSSFFFSLAHFPFYRFYTSNARHAMILWKIKKIVTLEISTLGTKMNTMKINHAFVFNGVFFISFAFSLLLLFQIKTRNVRKWNERHRFVSFLFSLIRCSHRKVFNFRKYHSFAWLFALSIRFLRLFFYLILLLRFNEMGRAKANERFSLWINIFLFFFLRKMNLTKKKNNNLEIIRFFCF